MAIRKNVKKLPIGIQTFSKIREDNYVYVDKTDIALQLIEGGEYYFLSRPRRFGKSLFVDTLRCIFEGKKELFTGLAIENVWDWSQKHPVISISFAGGVTDSRRLLEERILNALQKIAEQFDITPRFDNIADRFDDLICQVRKKTGQKVVVLVDEYDKPILDNITNPDNAAQLRECLKDLYSVIKARDVDIRFVFITGVSKFSKVSIFSGLNNLQDITLSPKYGAICGYTQPDLEREFKDHIIDCNLETIKQWYNGYNWQGEPVYNPFDILLFLSNEKEYDNYWFETGTPTFLIDLIEAKRYYLPNLEKIKASNELIGNFDIEHIKIEALLFQAGYLTIKSKRRIGDKSQYLLKYPNKEVKNSFTDYLLTRLCQDSSTKEDIQGVLYEALDQRDLNALHPIFHSFFASIPNDWYRKNNIAGYEGYYASIFYCYFASLGLDVTPEDTTNHGRIDMTLKMNDTIFIFEFKVVELVKEKNSALEQIKAKRYHEKYEMSGEVYLVGVEFSKEDRNIVGFEWEKSRQ